MERDCLIGHGSSSLLYERLSLSSDVYKISICGSCGLFKHEKFCFKCNSTKIH